MTHRKSQRLVRKIMVGLAVGTTVAAGGPARGETDTACFGAVVELYLAERASGSLDYLVCKATCSQLASAAERSGCRLGCRHDRTGAARDAREDAGALRVVCDGPDAAALRTTAAPVPSTCAPDLSACAAGARAAAKACDRGSDDLVSLSDCAAGVSAAVDQCATDFVNCTVPADEAQGQ